MMVNSTEEFELCVSPSRKWSSLSVIQANSKRDQRLESSLEKGLELEREDEGTISVIREHTPAQPCSALSRDWHNRVSQHMCVFWAPTFMLHRATGFILWPKGVTEASKCCLMLFLFGVFLDVVLFISCFVTDEFLWLLWNSQGDF